MTKENEKTDEGERVFNAQMRGLPDTATWNDIFNYDEEKERRTAATQRGLPEDASWEAIEKEDERFLDSWANSEDEEVRRVEAKKLRLPEDATWEQINAVKTGSGKTPPQKETR